MTGVEILSTQEVATAFTFNLALAATVLGVIFGVLAVIGIIAMLIEGDESILVIFLIGGLIGGLLFGSIAGSGDRIPTEYETQYKVTISDEVSMNDFLEIYEIVDQDGKIYTVRERND